MSSAHSALYAIALVFAVSAESPVAAAKCTMARVAEWVVKPVAGHIVVDGAINGQSVGVMLDTGSETMVFRSSADRLGLVRHETRRYRTFGIGGETHVELTEVNEFQLGANTRKNWRVIVAGERGFGKSIDMVLGEDFLDQFDVEFDLPHNAVRLYQVADCDGVMLAYWATQGAGQVDLIRFPGRISHIGVPVKINGKPVEAVFDSGAGSSVLDKPVAEQLGIKPDSPGVTLAGKSGGFGAKLIESWIAPLQSFTIGDETITDTVIRFADLWGDATYAPTGSRVQRRLDSTPALLLGFDFLRAHRVLVAHSQRKMYFTYEGGPVFQPKMVAPASEPAKPSPPDVVKPEAN